MKGSEAGQRPPLPLRELRRLSADSLREQPFTRLILRSTEKFHTGNEALFAEVRGELGSTFRYVPDVQLPKDPETSVTVAIASSNNRKVDKMLSLASAHELDVIRVPKAEEWHTKDVVVDATSKAVDAARILQESTDEHNTLRRDVRNRPHVTMATDQLNAIPVVVDDPVTGVPRVYFERVGKPINEETSPIESIRQRFQQMAATAKEFGWSSIPYIIELATVIHNPTDPENNAVSVQKSVVFLSVEGMQHLATDRFEEYLDRVNKQFDVHQIAGGLELQILEDMGMIVFITGTPSEVQTAGFPPHQRVAAKEHAYSLALGDADKYLVKDYFAIESKNESLKD